jgi:hypothetical protein
VYRKELCTARRNALTLTLISITLGACLEQEDSGEGFIEQPDPAPPGNSAPSISGSPMRAINIGSTYSFTPTASDPDGDQLIFLIDNKPGWANFDESNGALSGQPTLGHVGTYSNIRISVSDGLEMSSLPNFAISVDQVGTLSTTLSWTPPTENEDGSPLMDLAGYKIYWGTTPGDYTHSATIDNPGVSTYVVDNLNPGTYEFVATSFNSAGIESVFSNPATKVLN